MRKNITFQLGTGILCSLLIASFYLTAMAENKSTIQGNYRSGELIVKYNPRHALSSAYFYSNEMNIEVIKIFPMIGCQHVKLPDGLTVEKALKMYRSDPNVVYVEPNYIYRTTMTPDDADFNQLWGFHNTGQTINGLTGIADADADIPEAWNAQTGKDEVIVAVIDTGVKYDHEDLSQNIWVNQPELNGTLGVDDDGNGYIDDIYGYNFVNGSADPMDDEGHGTHVSGTIAGTSNNKVGVSGVCWKAKIMAIKSFNSAGSASTTQILSGIEYASKNGAQIINASWGSPWNSLSLEDAISKSTALFVCAAGNDSEDTDLSGHYPSSYDFPNIISVAATNQSDGLARFSNYGSTSVDVGAPGVNIYSTTIGQSPVFQDSFNDGDTNRWFLNSSDQLPDVSMIDGEVALVLSLSDYSMVNNELILDLSDTIDLTHEKSAALSFDLKTNTSKEVNTLFIEVSTDGKQFVPVGSVDDFSDRTWKKTKFDLNAFSGKDLNLRLRVVSNTSTPVAEIYIDNVMIETAATEVRNSYTFLDGTSMATPFVTGMAALAKSSNKALTIAEIKQLIISSVDPIDSLKGKVVSNGRVNLFNMLTSAPNPPTELKATTYSSSEIRISFFDNSSNESGFIIERSKSQMGPFVQIVSLPANQGRYRDEALEAYREYFYRVKSFNQKGESGYSNIARATTDTSLTPSAPTNLSGNAVSYFQVDLVWKDNSNNEDSFIIERKINADGEYTELTTLTADNIIFQDKSVKEKTTYVYRIKAINAIGHSEYSNDAIITTPPKKATPDPDNSSDDSKNSCFINSFIF